MPERLEGKSVEMARTRLSNMLRKVRPKIPDLDSNEFRLRRLLSTKRQYSQKELAAKLDVSISTVGRLLKKLESERKVEGNWTGPGAGPRKLYSGKLKR